MEMTVEHILSRSEGRLLQGDPSRTFRSWSIDSRLTHPGDLFFALVAARNGHAFLSQAEARGAAGAVVSEPVEVKSPEFTLIQVSDTLSALQRLAAAALADHPVKVIGITGSIGKTTTKEYTASLLAGTHRVLKSRGNFNNRIGLPLSLLDLEDSHTAAVLEMGMNHPGEIADLTRIAPPDIAVITNINPVHMEFFDSLDEVAAAKREILTGLKPGGTAVLNTDDPLIRKIQSAWPGRVVTFGSEGSPTVRASNIRRRSLERISFDMVYGDTGWALDLSLVYKAYLSNVLAGAAVALALGIPGEDVKDRAKCLEPLDSRGRLLRLKGIDLVDDTYNSNPRALSAALEDLGGISAPRRVAVLGDMLELGSGAREFHRSAGEEVKAFGWTDLVTVGPLARLIARSALSAGMRNSRIHSYHTSAEASTEVSSLLRAGDLVLVKGSRGMHMENIVSTLRSEVS